MKLFERVPKTISLQDLLGNETLLHKVQARASSGLSPKEALEGRHVLLFFARYVEGDSFTFDMIHNLRNVYHGMRESEEFEVVFFYCNITDSAGFEALYSAMPWTAIPFGDPRIETVRKHLKVLDMPKGIMISPDGRVMNRQVIKSLILDKKGSKFPWDSKPEPSCLGISG